MNEKISKTAYYIWLFAGKPNGEEHMPGYDLKIKDWHWKKAELYVKSDEYLNKLKRELNGTELNAYYDSLDIKIAEELNKYKIKNW